MRACSWISISQTDPRHQSLSFLEYYPKKDNDSLNKREITNALIFAVEEQRVPQTKEEIVTKYPNVFGEEVWQLGAEYRIKLDESVHQFNILLEELQFLLDLNWKKLWMT